MKCISCGGEVTSDEERCPYCHTINEAAVKKKKQLYGRGILNKVLKTEVLETSKEYRWSKILNRTMIIMAVLFAILVIITFVMNLLVGGDLKKLHKPSNVTQVLSENYEKQDFNRLYALLNQYGMMGTDHYKYSQIALIHSRYEDFITNRNECIEQIELNEQPGDFPLEYALREGLWILHPSLGLYDEMDRDNQKILSEYQDNVTVFFQAFLELSGEEIEELRRLNSSGVINSVDMKKQIKLIGERLGE